MGDLLARPRSNNPRVHSLLIRVTTPQHRLLEAVAALRRSTVAAYVHSLVEQNLAAVESDPLVQDQLRLFERFDARQQGGVVPMGRKRHGDTDKRG